LNAHSFIIIVLINSKYLKDLFAGIESKAAFAGNASDIQQKLSWMLGR
jgi:hypothetical protein